MGRAGDIECSTEVRGRVKLGRLMREEGGGNMNFWGSDLRLCEELKGKRRKRIKKWEKIKW